MKIISSRVLLLAASLLALPVMTAPALAQQAPPAGQPQSDALEEIVVTAQRREESVLQVSDSVQAFTGAALTQQGITNLVNLQYVTPGYLPAESSGYTQIFIRGVGNSIFVGADPSVATYIDDVPRIWGSMVNNLVDVERVEIPFAWEFADPELYARALASTGPAYEAMQNVGEAEFHRAAVEQAQQQLRAGLPLRAEIKVVGYLARKPEGAERP